MDKKKSVMDNLYKLEYRPAPLNQIDSDNKMDTDSGVDVAMKPSKDDTNYQKASRMENQNASTMLSNVISPPLNYQGDAKSLKSLKDAMLRRIEDYRMTKRDLISRVTSAQAEMSRDITDMKRILSEIEMVETQLTVELAELKKMPDLSESDIVDQTFIGIQSHNLEEMRLNIIRTIAHVERPAQSQSNQVGKFDPQLNLDSVTLGQILRYGFGLTLPIILALLLASMIIGFAIIAAFNGMIRW